VLFKGGELALAYFFPVSHLWTIFSTACPEHLRSVLVHSSCPRLA